MGTVARNGPTRDTRELRKRKIAFLRGWARKTQLGRGRSHGDVVGSSATRDAHESYSRALQILQSGHGRDEGCFSNPSSGEIIVFDKEVCEDKEQTVNPSVSHRHGPPADGLKPNTSMYSAVSRAYREQCELACREYYDAVKTLTQERDGQSTRQPGLVGAEKPEFKPSSTTHGKQRPPPTSMSPTGDDYERTLQLYRHEHQTYQQQRDMAQLQRPVRLQRPLEDNTFAHSRSIGQLNPTEADVFHPRRAEQQRHKTLESSYDQSRLKPYLSLSCSTPKSRLQLPPILPLLTSTNSSFRSAEPTIKPSAGGWLCIDDDSLLPRLSQVRSTNAAATSTSEHGTTQWRSHLSDNKLASQLKRRPEAKGPCLYRPDSEY